MTATALFVHTPFTDWILNTVLYSTLVLLAARVLLRVLRNTAAPLLSAICLALMAVLLILPFGSILVTPQPRPVSEKIRPFIIGSGAFNMNGRLSPAAGAMDDDPEKQGQPSSKTSPSIPGNFDPFLYYGSAVLNLLGFVWMGGFLLCLARLATGSIRLVFFRRSLARCDIPGLKKTAEILQHNFPGTKQPGILTSPAVSSPITCGLLDPVVILPPGLVSRCSPREMTHILLHEMSHIHHRDLFFSYFYRLMTAFYWWNPLARHIVHVFSRSREEISDNHAILASSPLEFARSLAVLAEQIGEVHKAPACPALTTSRISLEQRIRRILSEKRPSATRLRRPARLALLLAAGLLAAVILHFPWALAVRGRDQVVAILTELRDPTSITVDDSEIYITEEESVSIYSLEDYSLLRRFGKLGEKPGEFRLRPHLTAYPDHLLVGNLGRLALFTRGGDFLKEMEIPFPYFYMYFPMLPLGENYVGFNLKKDSRGGYSYAGILYDHKFSPLKEFYRGGPPQLLPPPKPGDFKPGKVDYEPVYDCLDIAVYDGRIYVADTRKGFHISIFDRDGSLISTIDKEYKKIPVPDSLKKDYMENVSRAPNSKDLLKRFNYKFRTHFPAFFSFKIRDGKMYFTTYKQESGKYELVEMALDGDIQKRSCVFPLHPLRRISRSLNSYTAEYDIEDGRLYYLERDPQGRTFYLHRLDLD